MAGYFSHPGMADIAVDPFPSSYSERVRRIGAVNIKIGSSPIFWQLLWTARPAAPNSDQ